VPRARDDRWHRRLESWRFLKRQPRAAAALRKHWPLPYQVEVIARGCEYFGLDARYKADQNLLLAILADVIFGTASREGRLAPLFELQKPKGDPGRKKDLKADGDFIIDCLTAMHIEPFTDKPNLVADRLEKHSNVKLFRFSYSGPQRDFKRSTMLKNIRKLNRRLKKMDRN